MSHSCFNFQRHSQLLINMTSLGGEGTRTCDEKRHYFYILPCLGDLFGNINTSEPLGEEVWQWEEISTLPSRGQQDAGGFKGRAVLSTKGWWQGHPDTGWVCGWPCSRARLWCICEGCTFICAVVTASPRLIAWVLLKLNLWGLTAVESCFVISAFLAFSTVGLIIMEDS